MTRPQQITWLVSSNPKTPGTKSFRRFADYFGAATVQDYLNRGGTEGDLKWDQDHGFLVVDEGQLRQAQTARERSIEGYYPRPDRESCIASATTALSALLPLDILRSHKAELIGVCIWKITEADGKWNTRFRSRAALGLPPGQCSHEHVQEIAKLLNRLLSGESISNVLKDVTACVVTRVEHDRLTAFSRANPSVDGWDRYVATDIEVIDLATRKRILP